MVSVTSDLVTAGSPRVGTILRNENRMISTLKRLQAKKADQENNGGFTLIELLIVIVVLGILAAVVVFSLGSVTGQSVISACQADGATVETAIAAYNAQVTDGTKPTSPTYVTGNPVPTAPSDLVPNYLASFPDSTHYEYAIDSSGKLWEAIGKTPLPATFTTPWAPWTGSGTCTSTTTN
jgi:prepilin-type N-terminal cleavage/methylation domain-containing protein